MTQPLVVLTYPGHFLLTAVTIRSYFQHNSPVPVTIIADDLSRYAWPEYLNDCIEFYASLAESVSVTPVSRLPQAHGYDYPTGGWLRQQMVKLYLDQLVPYTTWFFTDGDVQFHFPVPFDTVPYTITRHEDGVQQRHNAYVSKILGIDTVGIIAQHAHMDWIPNRQSQVCVSNPPFRTMHAKILQQLRQYVQELRGMDLAAAHSWIYNDVHVTPDQPAPFLESEWELLENFRKHVLNEDINLIYYPVPELNLDGKHDNTDLEFCTTCYASDQMLGRSWFEQQGLKVPDQIWSHLEKISK